MATRIDQLNELLAQVRDLTKQVQEATTIFNAEQVKKDERDKEEARLYDLKRRYALIGNYTADYFAYLEARKPADQIYNQAKSNLEVLTQKLNTVRDQYNTTLNSLDSGEKQLYDSNLTAQISKNFASAGAKWFLLIGVVIIVIAGVAYFFKRNKQAA